MISRPIDLNPDLYFSKMIEKTPGTDLISSLKENKKTTTAFFKSLDEEKGNFKYAEGKWTIKQLLRHITDCERILANRILRFSRNDKTDLPGFDENEYAKLDNCENLSIKELLAEFKAVRKATIQLFKTMPENALDNMGTANGMEMSARIVGWFSLSHCVHHLQVIQERYL